MASNEKHGGTGNFANDPKRAAEAGRKGGERSHSGQHQQGQSSDNRQQGSMSSNSDTKKSGQR